MSYPSFRPARFASPSDDTPGTGVRRRDVSFLPLDTLHVQVRDRLARVDGLVLTVTATGERFVMRDAVRVLGPAGQGTDMYGLTGRVLAVAEVIALGATLSMDALRLGGARYDIQPGYLVQPLAAIV